MSHDRFARSRSARPAICLVGALLLLLPTLGGCDVDAAQTATLQLPFGYRAQAPRDWTIQEQGGDFIFVLPDYARDSQNELLEMVAVGWRAAEGVERPDDPRVLEFFDDLMSDVTRVGPPQARASGLGPGLLLTYEGSFGAVENRRHIYLTLHDGDALFLLYGHDPRSVLAGARITAVEQIFASLAYTRPANDPAVAGGWRRETTTGSTGVTGNWFATDVRVFIIDTDGTVEYGSASTLSANVTGGYAFGRGDPDVLRGRYTAADGRIVFKWEGGAREALDYAVILHDGVPHLKLQEPGGQPVYFRRIE